MDRKEQQNVAKELRKYLVSDDSLYKAGAVERRFIDWFIDANFKKTAFEYSFTDGKKDGGIDAVLEGRDCIFILQSKYEPSCRVSTLNRRDLQAFERVRDYFADNNADFDKWIKTVDQRLIPIYKRIRDKKKRGFDLRFILFTTKRSLLKDSAVVEVQDFEDIAPLWFLHKEGLTPPIEKIKIGVKQFLPIVDNPRDRFRTLVALANLQDFVDLLQDRENERLFAQNVRTDLGTELNRKIKATYEKEPEKFWLGNNGLYIVCKKMKIDGDRMTLHHPSIINGSQTIHTIAKAKVSHPACQVLVRVLEMDTYRDSELLGNVIQRTNAQNPMNPINLSAHDPRQFNIARFLLRNSIFYERREKEWKNEKKDHFPDYYMITVKELGQWLAAIDWNIGPGKARSRTKDMFEDDYDQLFSGYDTNHDSRLYETLLKVVMAGIYSKALVSKMPKRFKNRSRIMTLTITRMIYEALNSSAANARRMEGMLRDKTFSGWKINREAVAQMRDLIVLFEQKQRAERTDDGDRVDFSNFFKVDDYIKPAYKAIYKKNIRRRLSRNLFVA